MRVGQHVSRPTTGWRHPPLMVMRASDPRQPRVPHWGTVWLVVCLGPIALLLVVWLFRVVFEFLRIVLS
jgi:hypothetical protein